MHRRGARLTQGKPGLFAVFSFTIAGCFFAGLALSQIGISVPPESAAPHMTLAPQSTRPSPLLASPALLLVVLLCLLAPLAWIESHQLNQPLMLALNHALDAQPPGQPLTPIVGALWSGITVMGLGLSMFLVFGALAERQPGWMAAYLLCLLIGGLMVHLLKHAIDAPRPAAVLSSTDLHVIGDVLRTRSMPSGHSASAFAFAAVILLTPNPSRLRRWLLAPALGAALLFYRNRPAEPWLNRMKRLLRRKSA